MSTKTEQKQKAPKVEIGQTVWFFDVNSRVYAKGSSVSSAAIYAGHWRETTVKEVSPRGSVTVNVYNHKFVWDGAAFWSKAHAIGRLALNRAEVDDDIWLNEHRHAIADKIRSGSVPVAVLKQVAALIGHDAK